MTNDAQAKALEAAALHVCISTGCGDADDFRACVPEHCSCRNHTASGAIAAYLTTLRELTGARLVVVPDAAYGNSDMSAGFNTCLDATLATEIKP